MPKFAQKQRIILLGIFLNVKNAYNDAQEE